MSTSSTRRRVVVTGVGVVTPVGSTVAEMWASLVAGKSGVDQIRRIDASTFPTTIGAEVRDLDESRFPQDPAVRAILDAYAQKLSTESIPAALERAARAANERVIAAALDLGLKEGVGTTLVAAVLHNDYLYFVSVGDSAIYHVRGGDIHMVNRPHVFANLLDQAADRGQISRSEAAQHPERAGATNPSHQRARQAAPTSAASRRHSPAAT